LGRKNILWRYSCFRKKWYQKENVFKLVGEEVKTLIGDIFNKAPDTRPRLLSSTRMRHRPRSHSRSSVHGIVRRSRSIQVDPDQAQGKLASILLPISTCTIRAFNCLSSLQNSLFRNFFSPGFLFFCRM
jgi:hypothetical protein